MKFKLQPAKSLQFGSNMRKATEYPGIIIPQVSWTGLSHLQMENEFLTIDPNPI